MIEIRILDETHRQDINIPNEPFALYGRMIPSYVNEIWRYKIVRYKQENISEMCFPDENYDFDSMKPHSVFIGAYDGDKCIALAILQDSRTKYMYLYDIKVCKAYRKQGIASTLLGKAKEICTERGYRGLYTQGQDNNLSACLLYVRSGFYIGGLDTNIYKGTAQEGKADIIFYLDC